MKTSCVIVNSDQLFVSDLICTSKRYMPDKSDIINRIIPIDSIQVAVLSGRWQGTVAKYEILRFCVMKKAAACRLVREIDVNSSVGILQQLLNSRHEKSPP